MEDLRRHVIVGQDDGVLFPLEGIDLRDQGGMDRPFHLRNDFGDAGIKAAGGPSDGIGIGKLDPMRLSNVSSATAE